MARTTIDGDESIAYGAMLAGVGVAASYPGSPSSGTMQTLMSLAEAWGLHAEWSTNEKVAFETAAGASIGGVPALMACKGVGFNVALDPLMVANLTDVGAGLVILLGDDPGAWASQNDQDTRPIAWGTELPMLEPATPAEGVEMTRAAFRLSHEMQMPVIVRITKSFAAMRQDVALPDMAPPARTNGRPFAREPMRWISLPVNAVPLHRRLHDRLDTVADRFEASPFNAESGAGRYGIIAAGFVHTKLMDILRDADYAAVSVFKLGTLWPLPRRRLASFLQRVDRALVLEENEPFLETLLKAAAYDAGVRIPLHGKQDRHVPREGELFRWQIAEALPRFWPGFVPARTFSPDEERKYMPSRAGLPENCPYTPVFETLRRLSEELGVSPVYVVDPGCAIKIHTPPFEMLDVKYSMGSSIGLASGLVRSGITDPVIAVVGDSDFFHLAANALFNVAHQGSNLLILILDNATTALSGFQPTPNMDDAGTGGHRIPLRIEEIVRACPVSMAERIDPWAPDKTEAVLRRGLAGTGVRVIVAQSPCPYISTRACPGYKPAATRQAVL
jgi:indolepyruvate ferredoxin oxidoreductase alpha subunit